ARRQRRGARRPRRRARRGHQRRPRHPHLPARRQGRVLRRADGSDGPAARRRLPQGGAGRAREIAMTAIAAARGDATRWLASAVVIVGLHALGVAALLAWHDPLGVADASSAVVVDLAPYAPPSESTEDVAPGPIQQQAAAPAPEAKVERKPDEKIEAKIEPKAEEKPEEKVEVPPGPVPPVAAVPPPEAVEPPPPPERKAQPAP